VDNGPHRKLTAEEIEADCAKQKALDEAIFEPREPIEYWDFPDYLRRRP
jgi:hypothetical protein